MTMLALLCFLTGLVTLLVAGVLLGFSDFIMQALIRSKPAAAIEVMQKINVTVFRSIFLTAFLFLTPVLLGLSVWVWNAEVGAAGLWVIAGTGLYLFGSFLVTIFGNVPMNNKLAAMDAQSAEAAAYWTIYGRRWTQLNTIRTLAGVAAALCLIFSGGLSIAYPG